MRVDPDAKLSPQGKFVSFVLKRDLDARDTYINFEVCAVDEDDDDVDLPYVRYHSGAL